MKMTALCYIKREGKTLMLHRVKKDKDIHKGKYNGLGGKAEAGESPIECVKREVFEESGLIIEKPILKGFMTFPEFKDGEDYFVHLFEAHQFTGELLSDSPEGNLIWINDEDISGLNLWEGDRIFFDYMNKYEFFMAKFIYKNGELSSHKLEYFR